MSFDYEAAFFAITDTKEKLNGIISVLEQHHLCDKIQTGSYTDQRNSNAWHYAKWTIECAHVPSYDPNPWRIPFKAVSALVGTQGAVIAEISDSPRAMCKGNEVTEDEIISTTAKGTKILDYDINPINDFVDEEDLDYLEIPHGYNKFEAAFKRSYGKTGKEILDLYSKKDTLVCEKV